MSAESQPISAERFALAIQDLPVENLYSKAHEIANSIVHLERSNRQLQEYIESIRSDTTLPDNTREESDKDCSDAIQENKVVIERQQERIELLKREVERRGARWHDGDGDGKTNGTSPSPATSGDASQAVGRTGGRLTDEQLRRQMMERMGDDDHDDSRDGMHL
ncbi:uncharacterized protein Z518_10751 [Rhinocladiella mackenziei CBS 650.93]|uniref:Uncharacterized protein n=1 Tax=Rhinocladiella mackenziei CBS 650.93 TaxID=1442369 RepID=A0A0D2I248_9EURO|nr:uncharacterized protein Z518_10751 [Rhinocladiella mackenziei CBS 650.93]KIW99823.1 hypothetical protein Z518_10751 [Rhinocladiella mackenziei CBS 650.93]